MRRPVTERFLELIFIFLFTALLIQVTQASSEVPTIKPQPLIAIRQSIKAHEDTPYQINPSNILWPPDCTTQDPKACLGSTAVESCTVEYCSKKVALTCWNHAYLIDFQCLCKSMSSTSCPSCNAGINQELYLAWLSLYCPLSPGWNGLPEDWNATLPGFEVLGAGQVNAVKTKDSVNFQTGNPFTSQFITDKHTFIDSHYLPSCTSGCTWLNARWKSSFVDGSVAAALESSNVFPANYKIGAVPKDGTLYVDLSVFCPGWKWSDLQSNCDGLCSSNLEPTSILLWLNTTCGQVTGFTGLPDGWHDSLAIVNSTFSDIFAGPSCLKGGNDTDCQISDTESSCTRTLCSYVTANGDCSPVSMVDMECFCTQVKYSDCTTGNGPCSSDLDETGLLLWLNTTCGQVTGFTGLPDDWHDSLAIVNSTFSDIFAGPSCLSVGTHPDCQLKSTESSCTRTLCSHVDENGDCSSVSMVDMPCFCSQVKYNNCTTGTGPCSSDSEETGLLLWLNTTCGQVPGFTGLPDGWYDSLSVVNSSYSQIDSFPWPSCLSVGTHPDCQLKATESSCTRTICNGTDVNGDCSTVSMVDMPCFCSQAKYGTSCTANCGLYLERRQHLEWLNDSCSSKVAPGTSLPLNWTSLLSLQRSDLLPWSWHLASDLPPGDPSQPHCPSASSKLLAFAAVNFAMFLLIPIIGRRTVIKKITFGYFGRQESQRWYYTGPIGVGLHLASNAINAAIIKGTVGFERTSIRSLTFFWCTRPRIAWLIVALLPYQADRSMYLSATASILFSEVILQFFAGYYMGVGADYARRQKFLVGGHLVGSWYAKEAMIMYAGSMLWLTAVPFAIAACLWSALGVSERIGSLGKYWTETKRVANTNSNFASTQVGLLRTLKTKMSPADQGPWQQQIDNLQNRLSTVIDIAIAEWGGLKAAWNCMPTELRKEQNNRRKIKREVQKAKARLDNCQEGTQKWNELWQATRAAEQDEIVCDQKWFTRTPETRQNEARVHQAEMHTQTAPDQEERAEVRRVLAACERNILPFEHAIAVAETRIAADDAEMERIKSEQRRWISSQDGQIMLDLRNHYEAIAQQRTARLAELNTASNHPQLILERNRVEKLQSVLDCWDNLLKLKSDLMKNWAAYQDQWRAVATKRSEERVMKPSVGHFPIVVMVGMLLCWIAQWLWWAGYVGVAGDEYCPPKLPVLASIWTIFSSMGAICGTSF